AGGAPSCVAAVPSGPTVTVTTNYYRVTGSTPEEIHRSKEAARPGTNRMKFDAITEWNITWTYRYSQRGDQFAVDSVNTKTTVVVTLPRWTPPAGTDPATIKTWQSYVQGLALHEQGHQNFARQAAIEVQRQLTALPASPSVRDLQTVIEQTGNRVVDQFHLKEKEYDQATNHGATQGAVLRW
ncbi:MAG: DUF922 domain-containing protein, partial [Verrucomicrobia bacterium]|nr:DUF922 domain-containing protein [Verrucomicrobiota bacterium]